jgi:electron transport complex protein RnfC
LSIIGNIRLKKKSSRHSVRLPENKVTAESPIEPMPLPYAVILPLQQNLGAPSKALVKRGEKVLTGQKIGDTEAFVSAPVHASLSGEVTEISTVINPSTGQPIEAIVISSDGADRWVELHPASNPESLSKEEILKRVHEAGIVGLGGATFPSHVKLAPSKDKKIDAIIMNGCECEPSITADHRLMLEQGEKILAGIKIIARVIEPQRVFIAIEDNKEDAIDHLEKLIDREGSDYLIVPLKSKYPTGAEKTLVKTILKREVPIGGLPVDVGVLVHNVATAKAIYDAIYEGKPLIDRVVTVTGAVKNPKNLLVRLGTPIKSVIDYCGGITEKPYEVIVGGPMVGIAQFDLDFPITKGANCILVQPARMSKEQDCINCGRCVEVCTMSLMPTLFPKYVKKGRYEEAQAAYVQNCVECGACTYNCPAHIPITQYIKVAKKELSKRKTVSNG